MVALVYQKDVNPGSVSRNPWSPLPKVQSDIKREMHSILSVSQLPFLKGVSSHSLLLTGFVYSRSQKNLQPGSFLALRLECLVGSVSKSKINLFLYNSQYPVPPCWVIHSKGNHFVQTKV